MANRQRDGVTEVFWRKAVQRCATSGLSARAFCRREQLTESAFYAWRRTIAQRDGTENARPSFVSAVVVEEPMGDASITIELAGGCVLKFTGPNATAQLADLVIALQSRGRR